MKKHMVVIGALTICGSLLVGVPSSFAAKSMNDQEMDQTTAAGAAGQIDIGNGEQTIIDNSAYTLTLDGQGSVVGGSVVNAAGVNNVAVAVNALNVDPTANAADATQNNDITQTHNTGITADGVTWTDGTVSTTAGDVTGGLASTTITAAGTVKIGHGDQTVTDGSVYSVDVGATAQQTVAVLSVVNAAGLNNVAVGINAANDSLTSGSGNVVGLGIGGSFGTSISQINTLIQSN